MNTLKPFYHVDQRGNAKCSIRLSRQFMEYVRKQVNKLGNCALKFSNGVELFSQGSGWYKMYVEDMSSRYALLDDEDLEVVKAMAEVLVAPQVAYLRQTVRMLRILFAQFAQDQAKEKSKDYSQFVRSASHRRINTKKVKVHGHLRTVTVDRRIQAMRGVANLELIPVKSLADTSALYQLAHAVNSRYHA